MGPVWTKAIDYLMQNARVLREAPLVFLAVLCLAFGGAYWLSALRYEGVLDQRNATIEMLKAQIESMKDAIADLQRNKAAAQSQPAGDPDAIYQLGLSVGTAVAFRPDDSNGFVYFDELRTAGKFNQGTEFKYRDFVLRVSHVSHDQLARMGAIVSKQLFGVTCVIIGRLH